MQSSIAFHVLCWFAFVLFFHGSPSPAFPSRSQPTTTGFHLPRWDMTRTGYRRAKQGLLELSRREVGYPACSLHSSHLALKGGDKCHRGLWSEDALTDLFSSSFHPPTPMSGAASALLPGSLGTRWDQNQNKCPQRNVPSPEPALRQGHRQREGFPSPSLLCSQAIERKVGQASSFLLPAGGEGRGLYCSSPPPRPVGPH